QAGAWHLACWGVVRLYVTGGVSSAGGRGPGDSTEILPDGRLDLTLRDRSDHPPALHAVLEENQQRDALHTEAGGGARIFVDVELEETDVAVLGRELLHDRSDHPAGSAPGGPEIDDRGRDGDLFAEVVVGQRQRMPVAECQRHFAAPANGLLAAAQRRDTVGLPAIRAAYDVTHWRTDSAKPGP